jgi:hypothetical protein
LFSPAYRRRVRPSRRSLGLSVVVCASALFMAGSQVFFFYQFYMPILATASVCLVVSWFRVRGLRMALPEPYGAGRVSTIDAKSTVRSGLMIVLGGILALVVLLGSVYVLPPPVFFATVFGLIAGLPLTEVVLFLQVVLLEKRANGRIFSVSEESRRDGEPVLIKTVELVPSSSSVSPPQ